MEFIGKFIFSLILTSVFYCSIPAAFSLLTKKITTPNKVRTIVIIQGVCIFLLFLFLGGGNILAAFIWCFIAYKISSAILNRRNLLSSPSPNSSDIVLDAVRKSANAGGNFGYIAQNVATIFYCIKEFTDLGHALTKDQLIFAALYIDSISYLEEGSFSAQDIDDIVRFSSLGMIGNAYMYRKNCFNTFSADNDELDHLACATAGIEIEMFLDGCNIDYHTVIDTVYDHYDEIAAMIRKTVGQGSSSPLFDSICPLVLSLFSDPDFIQIVQKGVNDVQ